MIKVHVLLLGAGSWAWHATVSGRAGGGADLGAGAKDGDDVSADSPPGVPCLGETPSDEESPSKDADMNRFFLVTSRICPRNVLISGSPSTLLTMAYSAGILTLKSRTTV